MINHKLSGAAVLSLSIACSPVSAPTQADPESIEIKEWQVPYESSRPRDPFVDLKGRVWFCGQAGKYLAYLEPQTGEFTKFALADGAGPHNLIIDDSGFIWFAANTKPYIGKLDPGNGEITKFLMPDDTARDPHTLVLNRDGDIWFTAQRSNYIGRLNTTTGRVNLIKVAVGRALPYGIRLDANDHPWIALYGTNKLASVDPETLDIAFHDLPREQTRPRRLEVTPDGMVWYSDYVGGRFGRLDPDNGKVTEWEMPGGETAQPYGSALDDKGVIWIAEGGSPSRIVSFDTRREEFTSVTDVPNARGAIRHMYFHGPTRELWFGEDTNYIGRLRVP